MAQCHGELSCGARVDQSMQDFLDDEADRLGVSKAEVLRRLLDFYKESREDDPNCPHCGDEITIDLEQ